MARKKKKRSPAQIAATKKLVAFNKRRKKNPAKKKRRVVKKKRKSISSVSQATKRAPTKRLKRRRAKPKVKGYFPNPSLYRVGYRSGSKKYYFDGAGMTSKVANAILLPSLKAAKRIGSKLADSLNRQIEIFPKR